MDEVVNKFLLAGGRFMAEIHLKQLGFTYNSCDHSLQKKRHRKI